MKKLISIILIATILCCSVSCGKKTPPEDPVPSAPIAAKPVDAAAVFDDVNRGDWFEDPVSWGVSEGITEPAKPDHFGVAVTLSKAEILIAIWKAAGAPGRVLNAKALPVSDPDSDYQRALIWAVERKIIGASGDEDVLLKASRLDAVDFMWKEALMPLAEPSENFRDTEGIQSVAWAKAARIAYGIGNDLFDPYSDCTKAHIITFLYRAK